MSEQKAVQAKPAEGGAPAKAATPVKKKRVESPVYKFYQVKGEKVERLRKECPRCGRGVFLGEHEDRLTCGKCGYTSFKKK